jgi:hypothetical protein
MINILDALCVFCDYNGSNYWQKGTHNKYCPFFIVGGVQDREQELMPAIKTHWEYYRLMHSPGIDTSQYYKE